MLREGLSGDGGVLVLDGDGNEEEMSADKFHPFDASHSRIDLDDISLLNNLHEAPLLHVIKGRFLQNKIYTYCAHVLISVNPYSTANFPNLYDLGEFTEAGGEREDNSPHVFSVAKRALDGMIGEEAKPQSVIITGESGSGKTEASKHILRYLIHRNSLRTHNIDNIDYPNPDDGSAGIQARLMESNVILEAFGNAKTVRNDNSSRFGKYIRVMYDGNNGLVGAKTDHFREYPPDP